jgi:hypothetical protein
MSNHCTISKRQQARFVRSSSTGTTLGRSQAPRPSPREEQLLQPPSETTEEIEKCGRSEEELYSENKLLPDIPEQSQPPG